MPFWIKEHPQDLPLQGIHCAFHGRCNDTPHDCEQDFFKRPYFSSRRRCSFRSRGVSKTWNHKNDLSNLLAFQWYLTRRWVGVFTIGLLGPSTADALWLQGSSIRLTTPRNSLGKPWTLQRYSSQLWAFLFFFFSMWLISPPEGDALLRSGSVIMTSDPKKWVVQSLGFPVIPRTPLRKPFYKSSCLVFCRRCPVDSRASLRLGNPKK